MANKEVKKTENTQRKLGGLRRTVGSEKTPGQPSVLGGSAVKKVRNYFLRGFSFLIFKSLFSFFLLAF